MNLKRDLQIPRLFHCPNGHGSGDTLLDCGKRNHRGEMNLNSIAVHIRCNVGHISLDNAAIGVPWIPGDLAPGLRDELAWIEAPNLGRKEATAVAHQWLLGSTDRIEHPLALQVTKYTEEATEVPEPFCQGIKIKHDH